MQGRDSGALGKSKNFPSKDRRKAMFSLISIALVILLDQLSKLWIRGNLVPGESLSIVGPLDLTYVRNTGSAFGLLANRTSLLIIITIVSLLIILLFLRYLSPTVTLGIVSLGLIFGGAVGNLIDRASLGYVTDFIDIRLWGDFHWPAFNFADAAIVIGILALIYSLYQSGLFRKVYEHDRRAKN